MVPKNKKKSQAIGSIAMLVVLIGLVLLVKFCKHDTSPANQVNKTSQRGKNFRTNDIKLTQHAMCRMDCRHITESEIKDVFAHGTINYRKSNVHDTPCGTYAVEYPEHGSKLRVVVADCNNVAKIITVIDLDKDFECDCPGDENK